MFQIFIKSLTGKIITVDIDETTTIMQIKEQIEEREGIPTYQQRLVCGGKELENNQVAKEAKMDQVPASHLLIDYASVNLKPAQG